MYKVRLAQFEPHWKSNLINTLKQRKLQRNGAAVQVRLVSELRLRMHDVHVNCSMSRLCLNSV